MFTPSSKTALVTLPQLGGRQLGPAAPRPPAPPQPASGSLTGVSELPESNSRSRKLGSRFGFDKQTHLFQNVRLRGRAGLGWAVRRPRRSEERDSGGKQPHAKEDAAPSGGIQHPRRSQLRAPQAPLRGLLPSLGTRLCSRGSHPKGRPSIPC